MPAKISPMNKSRTWYEIKNAAADVAEIYIYDQIGEDWWTGGGVTAKAFLDELSKITASRIDLHLNSPGGSVFDGVAIANALTRHKAQVVTYVDGLAASIASIIALSGERVVMASNSLFMIHNPWGGVQGTAEDMRKQAEVLDKIRDTLANTYIEKTGMTYEEVVALLDAETWYTAQEALAAGFIDEIGVEQKVAASFNIASLGFKHVPAQAEFLNSIDDAVHPVTPRQKAIYDALESIVELFGKFDMSTGPDGSHYVDDAANPFAAEGMTCANCVFYEGPRACEIVEGDIGPNAVCKFWVVPADLMSGAAAAGTDAPTDSESDGASDAVPSDGASDTPTIETDPQAFVPGVGFITFNRKR